MEPITVFNLSFAILAMIVGYYYSKKYTHPDFKILMWLGAANLLIEVWRHYNKYVLNLSGTGAQVNDLIIRAYAICALVLIIKFAFDYFKK